MALFQYPMMTVIQEMSARIGLITGSGLNTVIKRKYSNKIVLPLTSLLLIAKIKEISKNNRKNTITKPKISKKEIKMRSDTAIGMTFSQVIMWAIIMTTSGSLHAHNITDIQSAASTIIGLWINF